MRVAHLSRKTVRLKYVRVIAKEALFSRAVFFGSAFSRYPLKMDGLLSISDRDFWVMDFCNNTIELHINVLLFTERSDPK